MSNYIINQINSLDKSLCKCKFDIINNIKSLNKSTTSAISSNYDINKIKLYINELNNIRVQIKNIIHQFEYNIYDIEKNKIMNRTIDSNMHSSIEDKLYSLNFINDKIKETLKNIIMKIK